MERRFHDVRNTIPDFCKAVKNQMNYLVKCFCQEKQQYNKQHISFTSFDMLLTETFLAFYTFATKSCSNIQTLEGALWLKKHNHPFGDNNSEINNRPNKDDV